ncbi:hypothetical protein ACFQBQ_16420 [Granulicella cerasi]|uniref:PH domain-containing protein n=1 Tax=Granulicella cerasi TaxID=741063 RepID=A0ABW1ZCK8_9BACT
MFLRGLMELRKHDHVAVEANDPARLKAWIATLEAELKKPAQMDNKRGDREDSREAPGTVE